MRILISGGTGLIGNQLTNALLNDPHVSEIVILSRKKRVPHQKFTYQLWNGKNIPKETGYFDVVINLAGANIMDHPWTASFKKTIIDSRVETTKACVDFVTELQIPSLLIASAVGYYGTHRSEVLDETASPGKDFLAQTCLLNEKVAQSTKARTIFLRLGVVLAKEGGAFPRLLQPFKFYAGGYIGKGTQGFPWIHIYDVIGIIRYCIQNETLQGPINVVAPETLNNRQFGQTLGKVLHKPSGLGVPAIMVKSMLGERSMILLEGQFISSQKIIQNGYHFKYPDAESAIRNILES